MSATKPVIPDPRHIKNGFEIPSEGYSDQPYIVKTEDKAWLCVMTTGVGEEGQSGQHVISTRSLDQGKTWEKPVDIESSGGPEASYVVAFKNKSGRIYAFYNYNTQNIREVKREDGQVWARVDSLGDFVFKYSDDHGKSWSKQHYVVPVREFACDRDNVYGGKVRFFWNVGRPLVHGDKVWVPLIKVGAMGDSFFNQSEGSILFSPNLQTEKDPEKIVFETLPDGDIGLRTPVGGGRIAEEQSLSRLSDGTLYCVYRTIDGYPAEAYSHDEGHTWTPPAYKSYTPDGRLMKNPRAANFAWRLENGKFLYWFHNHGGSVAKKKSPHSPPSPWNPYDDRNPVWLSVGTEIDTSKGKRLSWSEPEIGLYDDDLYIRMSYPDLVEESGKTFLTETQKNIARVHQVPEALMKALLGQSDNKTVSENGLILNLSGKVLSPTTPFPALPAFTTRDHTLKDHGSKDLRQGFSLEMAFRLDSLEPGQILLDTRLEGKEGLLLATTDQGTVELTLNDGKSKSSWDTDAGVLTPGKAHHLAIIVDGGPKLILFVVDGKLCDGGDTRQFGWGRFSPQLQNVNGDSTARIAPNLKGEVSLLRIYNRAIYVSEAVGNARSVQGKVAV